MFTALTLRTHIPALLRKGALEELEGRMEPQRDLLTLGEHGVSIPKGVNRAGKRILRAVGFRADPPRDVRGQVISAPFCEWALTNTRQNLPNGRSRHPQARTSSACEAMTLGDATDGRQSDPNKIIMSLHVNWGHASARQSKRVLVELGGDNMHLLTCVDAVLGQREVCRSFEKARHVSVAGTSTAPMLNETLRKDLLFLGDILFSHATDAFSVKSQNPHEVRDAFCTSRIRVIGQPRSIPMDAGG